MASRVLRRRDLLHLLEWEFMETETLHLNYLPESSLRESKLLHCDPFSNFCHRKGLLVWNFVAIRAVSVVA